MTAVAAVGETQVVVAPRGIQLGETAWAEWPQTCQIPAEPTVQRCEDRFRTDSRIDSPVHSSPHNWDT